MCRLCAVVSVGFMLPLYIIKCVSAIFVLCVCVSFVGEIVPCSPIVSIFVSAYVRACACVCGTFMSVCSNVRRNSIINLMQHNFLGRIAHTVSRVLWVR